MKKVLLILMLLVVAATLGCSSSTMTPGGVAVEDASSITAGIGLVKSYVFEKYPSTLPSTVYIEDVCSEYAIYGGTERSHTNIKLHFTDANGTHQAQFIADRDFIRIAIIDGDVK